MSAHPAAERAVPSSRRRYRRVAAALIVVLAAVLADWMATRSGPDGERATRTTEFTTSTVRATQPVQPGRAHDATATPATGLVDGSEVLVTFERDADTSLSAQCAAEATTGASPDLEWCDSNVDWDGNAPDLRHRVVRIRRFIETSHGIIDCAAVREPCIIGAYALADGGPMWASIGFRDDIEPMAAPQIAVDHTSVLDGASITIRGHGFEPGEEVSVRSCLGTLDGAARDRLYPYEVCDRARGGTPVVADVDGRFTLLHIVYAELLDSADAGWVRCEPCVLVAKGFRQRAAIAAIEVTTDGSAIRPIVTISPGGPYEPEQRVALEGSGFQAEQALTVGWCAFTADDPSTQIEGDPRNGYALCVYPDEGFAARVDVDGEFTLRDFPMPSRTLCERPRARCGIASYRGNAAPPTFVTLFEIRK